MSSVALFLFLFIAVVIGWLLGRYLSFANKNKTHNIPSAYIKGLNYLFSDQPDDAIDEFIRLLEVTPQTFETHLALGTLLRKRGEVDRSIRLHQNLLSRPGLPQKQVDLATFELAFDYMSCGWLDRAERLFLELSEKSSLVKESALKKLSYIYEQGQDWLLAIDIACRRLKESKKLSEAEKYKLNRLIAHYYCQLSESEKSTNKKKALNYIQKALSYDKNSVRAQLLLAEYYLNKNEVKSALKSLQSLSVDAPNYMSEILPLVRRCFIGEKKQQAYQKWLEIYYDKTNHSLLAMELAHVVAHVEGIEKEKDYLLSLQDREMSPELIAYIIGLLSETADERTRYLLGSTATLVSKLAKKMHRYRCQSCGFSGEQLHWCCPSCKRWGTVAPVNSFLSEE